MRALRTMRKVAAMLHDQNDHGRTFSIVNRAPVAPAAPAAPAAKAGTGEFRNFRKTIMDHMVLVVQAGAKAPSHEALAGDLHISLHTLRLTLDDLMARGQLQLELRHSLKRYVIPGLGATAWTPPGRSMVSDVAKAAMRKCLCCSRKFWSSHKGNRLCDSCHRR